MTGDESDDGRNAFCHVVCKFLNIFCYIVTWFENRSSKSSIPLDICVSYSVGILEGALNFCSINSLMEIRLTEADI